MGDRGVALQHATLPAMMIQCHAMTDWILLRQTIGCSSLVMSECDRWIVYKRGLPSLCIELNASTVPAINHSTNLFYGRSGRCARLHSAASSLLVCRRKLRLLPTFRKHHSHIWGLLCAPLIEFTIKNHPTKRHSYNPIPPANDDLLQLSTELYWLQYV